MNINKTNQKIRNKNTLQFIVI